jgi:hypothetical protein
MNKDLRDYVYLDGVYFKEEQILKMATNAGSFSVAEHYLCAYLAHGLQYGKTDIINKVNDVREMYHVPTIPLPDNSCALKDEYGRSRVDTVEMKIRKIYARMDDNKKLSIMRSCLSLLIVESNLFHRKADWLAILLVIRDRLDGSINQSNFLSFATRITPEGWPQSLRMSAHTATNFSKLLRDCDWTDAYYDMDSNPVGQLCDKFWEIVKQAFLTEIQ